MIDKIKKKLDVPRADVSQHLKTDKEILSYLKTAAEDINPDSIIIALNNIARIKGINNLVKKFKVPVEDLYDFVNNDNSTFDSSILNIDAIK